MLTHRPPPGILNFRCRRREWREAFFRHDPAYADVPPEFVGFESEERELTGGDVLDALAWAAKHTGPDRTWTLYVAGSSSESSGLIWLAGMDPNAANAPFTTWRFTVSDGAEESFDSGDRTR